jgi:hypothetical protein
MLDDREPTYSDRKRLADLRETLKQIEAGAGADAGVDPRFTAIIGKPGLHRTERTLLELYALRDEATAEISFNPGARGLYRLRADAGTHVHEGVRLKAGEVVELDARQAKSFADKFEPVLQEAVLSEPAIAAG